MIKSWVMRRVEVLFQEWAAKESLKVDEEMRQWQLRESMRAEAFRDAHIRHGQQIELGLNTLVTLVGILADKKAEELTRKSGEP